MNAIILCGSGAPPSPYYPVGDDCVLYHAYWDGTAVDHSSQGNDGTIVNSPSFNSTGIILNGTNQYLTVLADTSLNIGAGEDFTVLAWVKLNSSPYAAGTIYVVYAGEGSFYMHSNMRNNEDPMQVQLSCTPGVSVINPPQWQGGAWWPSSFTLMGWHMFRGSNPDNPRRSRFSKNGVYALPGPYGFGEIPSGAMTFGDGIRIGGWPYLGGYYLNGSIGEIYFFKSFVSEANTLSLFNATKSRYGL